MADEYNEKKDKMRREALAEEKARLDSTAAPAASTDGPPPRRFLPAPAGSSDTRARLHPDDYGPLVVLSDERIKSYAPTLAEFEKLYGSLPADSYTRKRYLEMESAPAQAAPPQPPSK